MKSADRNKNRNGELEDKVTGSTAQIREVVQKVKLKTKCATTPGKQVRKVLRVLKKKDKEEIVQAVLEKYYNSEELKPYQAELIKMQRHLERTGKKMVILFDGRDASGKGGTIRRVTRYMNEKRYHTVALGKPNEQQKTELHIKRYIEHFPHAGEVELLRRRPEVEGRGRGVGEQRHGRHRRAARRRLLGRRLLGERRLEEAADTGAEALVTACPRCVIHLRCAREGHGAAEPRGTGGVEHELAERFAVLARKPCDELLRRAWWLEFDQLRATPGRLTELGEVVNMDLHHLRLARSTS